MGKRSSHAALAIRLAEIGHPGTAVGDQGSANRSASRAIAAASARKAMASSA